MALLARKRQSEPQTVRRQQLIEATIECIARHGITGTTSARVTAIAELSVGMINLHFESKDDLLASALRHMVSEHDEIWRRQTARANLSDPERLLVIVDSHFLPEVCSPKRLSAWYAFFGEASYRDLYHGIADGADNARKAEIVRLCEAICRASDYPHVDPLQTAMTLEALFDGHWLNMLMYPGEFSEERSKAQIRGFLAGTFPAHFRAHAQKGQTS